MLAVMVPHMPQRLGDMPLIRSEEDLGEPSVETGVIQQFEADPLQGAEQTFGNRVGSQGYHLPSTTVAEHLCTLNGLLLVAFGADDLEVTLVDHLGGNHHEDGLPTHRPRRQKAPKNTRSLSVVVDQAGGGPAEQTVLAREH